MPSSHVYGVPSHPVSPTSCPHPHPHLTPLHYCQAVGPDCMTNFCQSRQAVAKGAIQMTVFHCSSAGWISLRPLPKRVLSWLSKLTLMGHNDYIVLCGALKLCQELDSAHVVSLVTLRGSHKDMDTAVGSNKDK